MGAAAVFTKRHEKADFRVKKSSLSRALVVFCLVFSVFPAAVPAQTSVENLSPEVHAVLDKKIELLKSELASDPLVIETARKSSEANQYLSAEEIAGRDNAWQNTPGFNDAMKEILLNPCSKRLVEFQDQYDGFPEIFLTDARGLNAAMTNKTTDYYQADEDWWVRTFADGQGHFYYGEIGYDESSMSESIPVYIPVIDPQTQKTIGVIKALLDIVTIRMEL